MADGGSPEPRQPEREGSRQPSLPVCVFLIPLLRDSDRQPHPPIAWRLLQDALRARFHGLTGPETVVLYRGRDPVPGQWEPEDGQTPIEDESRRYTLAIPQERVAELRQLLRQAGNTFDQQAMYLEVAGYAEILAVRPEDGFLDV